MKILDLNEEYVYNKLNTTVPPYNEYISIHLADGTTIPAYYKGENNFQILADKIVAYGINEDDYLGWTPIPKLSIEYDCYFTAERGKSSTIINSSLQEIKDWLQEILDNGYKGTFLLFIDTHKEKKIHSTEIIKNGINKVLNEWRKY